MKSIATATLVFAVITISLSQNQITQAQLTLGRLSTLNSMGLYSSIDQMTPEGKVVGSPYYDENWDNATLVLFANDERIENYPVRYNIYNNIFEIKVAGEVKGLEGKRVKEYLRLIPGGTTAARRFINISPMKAGDIVVDGFAEVLSDGELLLLKKTDIVIKKPDYSEQFSVGSRDTQITKKDVLFYSKGDGIFELPRSSKKITTIFGSKSSAVADYMDNNKIKIKDEYGLRNIFDFYNQLN